VQRKLLVEAAARHLALLLRIRGLPAFNENASS